MKKISIVIFWIAGCLSAAIAQQKVTSVKPNVIIINADDLGYGDLSCYGATKIQTPHVDHLAAEGLRFTNAHSTSATCTPSRYALLTGKYPWRQSGTNILPGDAALIIPTDRTTLPLLFKNAGYHTGLVGKWHLGLGNTVEKNWNAPVKPGPNEVGFQYSFIFPATADRVPTVFVENGNVVAADAADPIRVNYKEKTGSDPTGKENPELLKMRSSPGQGHDNTIVNGIGRIGWMSGGYKARWTDEEMPLTFLEKARQFIADNKATPFFLYYSLTEPHVPRMPSTMFKGKSELGYRGDVILQLDWTVGQIMKELALQGIAQNTIVIFTSDNGPVIDDGYQDESVERLNGHTPWGIYRGGKYSSFEAGTRIPFIVSWPRSIKAGVSGALVCQMDLLSSFRQLLDQRIPERDAQDSENILDALLGKSATGRETLVKQGIASLAIIKNGWKYIEPNSGQPLNKLVNIETGNDPDPQLYDLTKDPSEKTNLATRFPDKVKELAALLETIRNRNQGL